MSHAYEPNGLPYLTTPDIQLLHEIVKRAQESEEQSSRALFQAYDSVLTGYGIDSRRDPKYIRFLLRMRKGSHKQTKPLVDQFTDLLSELGVEVVFDEEEENHAHVESAPQSTSDTHGDFDAAPEQALERGGRLRRASYGEVETSGNVVSNEDAPEKSTIFPRSISQNELYGASSQAHDHGSLVESQANGRAIPPASHLGLSHGGQKTHPTQQESRRRPVVQIREEPSIYEFEQSVASDEVSETEDDHSAVMHAPSQDEDPNAKAAGLRFRQLAARAHGAFHDWHKQTVILRTERQHLIQQAVDFDRRVLAKQSIDHWRDQSLARKHESETVKFFDALARRAERARDLFLLTKAFTHWAQYASDEVLRTSAARRHILRTRFFNAWRDITAVNELKVRRQGISKFFSAWRRRNSHLSDLRDKASNFRSSQLAQTSYRNWFWDFCDRRAPIWHDSRIQSRCWDQWSQLAQGYTIRAQWCESYARLQLLRKIWTTWTGHVHSAKQLSRQADDCKRTTVLMQSMETWRRRLFFANPIGRMSQARKTKLLRNLFQAWLDQARFSLTSKKAHDLRLMRNAWTSWNDRLRGQALARVIDDRIILQSLYRWVLAERLALFKRIASENVKNKLFWQWRQRTQTLCSALGRSEHWMMQAREMRLKSNAFGRIRSQAEVRHQLEMRAVHKFEQKSLGDAFSCWAGQWHHVHEQQFSAGRIQFLLLAAPRLKKWRESLEITKKTRRREAFATIRRRHREANVRTVFSRWRNATAAITHNSDRARQRHDHKEIFAMFLGWHASTQQIHTMNEDADVKQRKRVMQRTFFRMYERMQKVRHLQDQAEAFHIERIVLPAAEVALRRLSWRAYQIQGRQAHLQADDLRRRHERDHHRLMLRHMSDRVKARREHRSPLQSPSLPAQLEADITRGNTMFSRSIAAAGVGAGATTAPTPGYLQTPLRRTTGRLRTRIPPPPATPGPSHVTPFMSRLRAEYPSGLPRSTRGEASHRRGFGQDVDDIPELSPAGEVGG